MIVIEGIKESIKINNAVVTIGNFDGIHLGHKKIFDTLIKKANEVNGSSLVITFNPHPLKVLYPEKELKMITTFEDKLELIRKTGISAVIVVPFDRSFANTDADEFISNFLVNKINIKGIVVGHGYVFGKGKRGNTELLRKRGKKFGFFVKVVRAKKISDNVASSSRIRTLIGKGKVKEASLLLSRAYHINGKVIKGTGRGANILNIPTANIETNNELTPPDGVYAVKVSLFEQSHKIIYNGVANIGNNPTFGNTFRSYEVHIFDYNDNLIGKEIRLHFIKRIREEIKFDNINSLRQRILKDIEIAKEIHQV
ncbi:MAG: bifunctional riboflavin kinase/FAD synthetase, partial [Thermodesulfovibrionales bacterium]|nr:bifunctional riboflavin kinase/FAD synthetase [Thermodesulfovibrionales bacterium]